MAYTTSLKDKEAYFSAWLHAARALDSGFSPLEQNSSDWEEDNVDKKDKEILDVALDFCLMRQITSVCMSNMQEMREDDPEKLKYLLISQGQMWEDLGLGATAGGAVAA